MHAKQNDSKFNAMEFVHLHRFKVLSFLWRPQRFHWETVNRIQAGRAKKRKMKYCVCFRCINYLLFFCSFRSARVCFALYQVRRSPLTIGADSDVSLLIYADVLVICKAQYFFSSFECRSDE